MASIISSHYKKHDFKVALTSSVIISLCVLVFLSPVREIIAIIAYHYWVKTIAHDFVFWLIPQLRAPKHLPEIQQQMADKSHKKHKDKSKHSK